ncbi:MAG: ribosome biogenesis GTPase Der [Candidatus Euphemobacter frigidus]|nr:ribosome biogenesis GTPase Der [Candidatus Euphemobacter frigidus]MDP8274852.1 ribosome biogenesis GTPase Der [Candidatus Euphemobacter frigidus]
MKAFEQQYTPPLIAIIGRPNVGKSTLFNRLIGHRVAVVHSEAGTTRDRIYGDVLWDKTCFQVVDTGGLIPGGRQGLNPKIARQVEVAIEEAALCLLVVDVQDGLTPLDEEVATLLRRQGKSIIVAVNKADNAELELGGSDFTRLGFDHCLTISATHGLGINDLLNAIVEEVPHYLPPSETLPTSLAIVGRPNVGKSTLVNRLIGDDRVVVDAVPGTTRDAVDSPFHWEGREFSLIDTAGLQRRSHSQSALDFFSLSRTKRGIRRADLVLLLLETPRPPTRVDAIFIKLALTAGKGCILGVNKWDLAGSLSRPEYQEMVRHQLQFAGFLPMVFFSGLTGRGIKELMEAVIYVSGQREQMISTGVLNRVLQEAQKQVSARRRKHKKFRIFYATQVKTAPPVFRLFVNDPGLLAENYEKYLQNTLRRAFGFEGVPLKFVLKKRSH